MKLLKRLMSKRNNAGFTLVEVVISIALLGILLVSMTMFVGPVLSAAAGTKKDIRASILSETIDAYIDRSIKNARYVAVFGGVAISGTQKTTDMQAIYNSEELKKFKAFFNADNEDKYEVRCIGINWTMDDRTNESKYILTLGKVGIGTGDNYVITQTNKVFEDCFYDGLYPKITIEQVVSTEDSSKAPALKSTIEVYTNDSMDTMAISGTGYTQLINVTKDKIDESMFIKTVRTPAASEQTDTYIFYITRSTF